MSRARNWCFTAWEPLDWGTLVGDIISYIIVGKEVCPDTKKVHYQGYVECHNSMRLNAMKLILGEKTHLEGKKGTQEQAIDYCKKDGEWTEHGKKKADTGKRSDMETVRGMIHDRKEDHEIVEEITGFQALRCIDTMRAKMVVPHAKGVKAVRHDIETTEAKLNDVLTEIGDYDAMSLKGSNWIGYTGHSRVVIVVEWLDRMDVRVRSEINALCRVGRKMISTKGGSCVFAPDDVYIITVE